MLTFMTLQLLTHSFLVNYITSMKAQFWYLSFNIMARHWEVRHWCVCLLLDVGCIASIHTPPLYIYFITTMHLLNEVYRSLSWVHKWEKKLIFTIQHTELLSDYSKPYVIESLLAGLSRMLRKERGLLLQMHCATWASSSDKYPFQEKVSHYLRALKLGRILISLQFCHWRDGEILKNNGRSSTKKWSSFGSPIWKKTCGAVLN